MLADRIGALGDMMAEAAQRRKATGSGERGPQVSRNRYIPQTIRRSGVSADGAGHKFVCFKHICKHMGSGMEWTVVEVGNDMTLVELSGRMDVAGALKADPAFAAIAEQHKHVIVDLTKLDFLASLGIRTLVSTCKTLRAKDGGMVLLAPQPNIEQVLRSSGIDTIIPVVADRAEAEAQVLA